MIIIWEGLHMIVKWILNKSGPSSRRQRLGFLTFDVIFGLNLVLLGNTVVKADTVTSAQQMLNQNAVNTMNNSLTANTNVIMPLAVSTASITHSGTNGTADWDIDSDGKLTIHAGVLAYGQGNWSAYASSITSVYVEPGVTPYTEFYAQGVDNGVFSKLTNVKTIDVTNLDVSKAKVLSSFFKEDPKLTQIIGLDKWDTSNCETMESMFDSDLVLTNIDVSNFNTQKVSRTTNMFISCRALESLDVSNFNTSNLVLMDRMFAYVPGKITGLNNFDTSKVTNLSGAFTGTDFTKTNPDDIKDWDVSSVTNMSNLFQACKFSSLDLSNWDLNNVTNMSYMFASDNNIDQVKNIADWDVSKVINMSGMFSNVTDDDLSVIQNWDVSNVENMASMFENCANLKSLDLSNWNTKSLTTITRMFNQSKLLNEDNLKGYQTLITNRVSSIAWTFANTGFTAIDFSKADTSNIIDMSYAFYGTSKLKKIIGSINTSKVTAMNNMFSSSAFDDPSDSNIASWDLSKVKTLDYTFSSAKGTNYDFIKNWNVSNVTSMQNTFASMTNAKTVPVENWDVSNVTNFYQTFYKSSGFTSLPLTDWNVSKATNMSGMFWGASSLKTLDINKWDTAQVTTFYAIFNSMDNLEKIDMSNLDTTNATDVQYMFGGDTNLWKITLGPKSVLTNLKGGANPMNARLLDPVAGTVVQDDSADKTYTAISDKWQEVGADSGGTDHAPVGDLISADEIMDKFSVTGNPVTTYVWQQHYKIDMSLTVPDVDFGTTTNASGLVKRKGDFDITVVNKNYPTTPIPSKVMVAMDQPLTDSLDSSKTLNDVLIFKDNNNKEQILSAADTEIYSGDIADGSNTLSWDNVHGLLLNMNNDKYAKSGHYSTTLKWTLTNSI